MKKNVLFIVAFIVALVGCNSNNSSDSSINPYDDDYVESQIDEKQIRETKDLILTNQNKVNKVDFYISHEGLVQEGSLRYGINETLLKSEYEEESLDLDRNGNLLIEKYDRVVYAKIDNKHLFYVNYYENNIEASNSIGYLISNEDGDNNINEMKARELLNDSKTFIYSLNWFMSIFDDLYLGGFPSVSYQKFNGKQYDKYYGIAKYEVSGEEGFVYIYESTIILDKNGYLLNGEFYNYQYEYSEYNSLDNPMPYNSYIYKVDVSYGEKEDINFDYSPYFISNISDATFTSYTSTKSDQVCVGENIVFDINKYDGELALDALNYYISNVEDKSIIDIVDGHYKGIKAGKTKITIANAYNNVHYTKEIQVVHPKLIGFNAYTSNGTQEITKKVDETDFIELAFSPEGALHKAECKINEDSKELISLSEPKEEKRGNCVYIVYDVKMLKNGAAKVTVTPFEVPTIKIVITFNIGEK